MVVLTPSGLSRECSWEDEPECSLGKKMCKVGKMMAHESVPVGGLSKKRIINKVISGGQWSTYNTTPNVSKIPRA